jgi:hypothetical protein
VSLWDILLGRCRQFWRRLNNRIKVRLNDGARLGTSSAGNCGWSGIGAGSGAGASWTRGGLIELSSGGGMTGAGTGMTLEVSSSSSSSSSSAILDHSSSSSWVKNILPSSGGGMTGSSTRVGVARSGGMTGAG